MNKQTVFIPASVKKDWDCKFLVSRGTETYRLVNKLESVYVLTEDELKERDMKNRSEGWDAADKRSDYESRKAWYEYNNLPIPFDKHDFISHPLK